MTDAIFASPEQAAHFWLFIFGLWAVCAVLCLGLADWHGKSRLRWGLLGFFFGPVALLILVFRLWFKPGT